MGPEVPSSKEHVGDAPRVSLTDPHKWLHKLHTFARNAGIEQPINLAEKTGATGSSPMFLLALGCMLGVTFDNVAGDERTARRLRRTGDDEADGENVYSSASRTYTPGDFDEPPDMHRDLHLHPRRRRFHRPSALQEPRKNGGFRRSLPQEQRRTS